MCDFVILCSVDADIQRQRALQRTGMTEAKLDAILESQMPLATKRARADAVIETSHGTDAARQALFAILNGPVRQLRETKIGASRNA